MENVKVRIHELSVFGLERDRLLALGIPSECLTHVDIGILEMPYPVRRVKIEGRLEVPVVELFQEVFGVGEERFAPGITCSFNGCDSLG